MTLVKNLNILPNLFLLQKGLDMMFDGILDKKEVFLNYKNITLRFAKNWHIFPKGLTHDFGPNVEISSKFSSLQKGLDMRLDKVLDKNVESLSRLQKWHLL